MKLNVAPGEGVNIENADENKECWGTEYLLGPPEIRHSGSSDDHHLRTWFMKKDNISVIVNVEFLLSHEE